MKKLIVLLFLVTLFFGCSMETIGLNGLYQFYKTYPGDGYSSEFWDFNYGYAIYTFDNRYFTSCGEFHISSGSLSYWYEVTGNRIRLTNTTDLCDIEYRYFSLTGNNLHIETSISGFYEDFEKVR